MLHHIPDLETIKNAGSKKLHSYSRWQCAIDLTKIFFCPSPPPLKTIETLKLVYLTEMEVN